uniref:LOW QUALITY PROTEIN: reticuline oxidase-like n=1 Tax=Nicotiana sylvestris TaxID=4096 RepID=A0A1U7XXZ7_NICSY|nr:PREDICTED: LOW QUALITY PROTEIN: reticuline oxidase-like [Nicotiana sylvestris]
MFPLIILISFSFTFLSASATSGAGEGVANLSTCLINHNVHNFSMYPTSRNYFNLLDFSLQNLRFAASNMPKPTVIILPNSKEELVSTILCCRQTSYEIRVRCGGHSYEGTSSVFFDGSPFVIIDLMKLDDVSVDLDSETAWAQGGATIGQIYYAIAKASDVHAFSAGSGPTVGSGGHISGGGFGLPSRKFGVADSVVDASGKPEIFSRLFKLKRKFRQKYSIYVASPMVDALLIDADGRLLDRKAMGEDVFWAIRGGGGGNWGIIYAWKIRLVKVPKIVTTFKISKPGYKQYVAPLLYKCTEILLLLKYVPNSMDGIMTALVEHEKNPNAFLVFDPYGGAMDKISDQAIAFPHRKGNLFAIQYYAQWNEEDDAKSNEHIEWIRGFYNKMAPFVSSSPRGAYVNYLDMDLGMNMDDDYLLRNASSRYSSSVDAVERARAWGEKYFLNNYDRLVKAKTKIDPLNVFRHEQSIPPRLGSTQEHNYSSE